MWARFWSQSCSTWSSGIFVALRTSWASSANDNDRPLSFNAKRESNSGKQLGVPWKSQWRGEVFPMMSCYCQHNNTTIVGGGAGRGETRSTFIMSLYCSMLRAELQRKVQNDASLFFLLPSSFSEHFHTFEPPFHMSHWNDHPGKQTVAVEGNKKKRINQKNKTFPKRSKLDLQHSQNTTALNLVTDIFLHLDFPSTKEKSFFPAWNDTLSTPAAVTRTAKVETLFPATWGSHSQNTLTPSGRSTSLSKVH